MNTLDEPPRWLLGIVAAAHGAVLLGLTTLPATQRFVPPQVLQVALITLPAAVLVPPSPARPAEARSAQAPHRVAPAPAPTPVSAPTAAREFPAQEKTPDPAPAVVEPAPAAPSAAPSVASAVAVSSAAPSVASAPAASSAAPAVAAVLPPRFDADYLNNPKPPYPPLARRMGEEGKVILRVHVTPDGLPDRIELAESSGSPRLDEAAFEAVRHWRFVPARQGEAAIAAWVRVPIAFRLEKNR